ncbi:transglutaminase family protein [Pelomonas sp. CA6]|uniref:transglutaminase family protein n=1 Tax=Pelomonas sp. CA6 TaxID=2907999 RepID=UPI001F4B4C56|nr:transglutaminase family protein [Pelomonas sp. CA6]MCH7342659.1 transglutaminase family protein [Pelomonas sp. CA6]
MHLHISHETVYVYEAPLSRSTQYLRLTPRGAPGVQVLDWQLTLPGPATRCEDAFGNPLHVLSLDGPRREIHLIARGEVITCDDAPRPQPPDGLPTQLFLRDTPLTRADAALAAFAAGFAPAAQNAPHEALMALMRQLGERMPYVQGATDAATAAAQAFASGHGVCQDHAQVFVACARRLGLPARYVSGYLATDAEHVASHAWAEVFLPAGEDGAAGWLGYDVSNQCLANGRHVKLAIGADYLDACPVRGVRLGGGLETLHALVQVRPRDAATAAPGADQ